MVDLHLEGDAIGKGSTGDSETLLLTIHCPLDGLALTGRRGSSRGGINGRDSRGGGINGRRSDNDVAIVDKVV
jgi:hypothetical protein